MLTTKAIEGLQATGKQFEMTDGCPACACDARDITRADVTDLIEGIAEARSPFGASNVFRAGRTVFNWLVSREVISVSPTGGSTTSVALSRPTSAFLAAPTPRSRVVSTIV